MCVICNSEFDRYGICSECQRKPLGTMVYLFNKKYGSLPLLINMKDNLFEVFASACESSLKYLLDHWPYEDQGMLTCLLQDHILSQLCLLFHHADQNGRYDITHHFVQQNEVLHISQAPFNRCTHDITNRR